MTRRERIRQLLADSVCVDVSDCKNEASIKYDLAADSLSLLSFVTEIYEEYNIGIPEDQERLILSKIITVEDLIVEVEKYVETRTS